MSVIQVPLLTALLQGNMKQHQMTHKFRDGSLEAGGGAGSGPTSPLTVTSTSPVSSPAGHCTTTSSASPFTSPAGSEPLSPPYPAPANPAAGTKRGAEEEPAGVAGVASLVDRPPEKRAILCG